MKEIYKFTKFLSAGIIVVMIIVSSVFGGYIIINGSLQFDLPIILALLITIVILVMAYAAYVLSKIKLKNIDEEENM